MTDATQKNAQIVPDNLSVGELNKMYKNKRITSGISNGQLIFLDSEETTEDRWSLIQADKEKAADAGTSYGNVTDNSDIIARFGM